MAFNKPFRSRSPSPRPERPAGWVYPSVHGRPEGPAVVFNADENRDYGSTSQMTVVDVAGNVNEPTVQNREEKGIIRRVLENADFQIYTLLATIAVFVVLYVWLK